MPKPNPAQTYLADTEASHIDSQALPGAIVIQLRREVRPDTSVRAMFIELTVAEAVQHWRQMGNLIRKAGALEQQASHADASLNF